MARPKKYATKEEADAARAARTRENRHAVNDVQRTPANVQETVSDTRTHVRKTQPVQETGFSTHADVQKTPQEPSEELIRQFNAWAAREIGLRDRAVADPVAVVTRAEFDAYCKENDNFVRGLEAEVNQLRRELRRLQNGIEGGSGAPRDNEFYPDDVAEVPNWAGGDVAEARTGRRR